MRKKIILTLMTMSVLAFAYGCGSEPVSAVVPTTEPEVTVPAVPTMESTSVPTEVPTETPTPVPTETPTPKPTETPTPVPTETPTPTPTEAPHEHAYTEAVTLEATCTADGEKTFTCECGDSYKEAITALGHTYVEDETTKVEATCEVDGKASDTKCSVCGDVVAGEVVTATGHIFESYTSNNDATYTVDGTETAKCNNCDATDTRVAEGSMLTYSYTDMDATMYAQKSVNVRSLPSTDGEKLGGLSTNDEVKVTGQCMETSWYRIEYNGQVGYVSNNYLGNDKVVVQAETSDNGGNSGSQSQSDKLAAHFGITLPCTANPNTRLYRNDTTVYHLVWNSTTSFKEENFMGWLYDGTQVTIHELSGSKNNCMAYITTADGLAGWVNFYYGSCYRFDSFSW